MGAVMGKAMWGIKPMLEGIKDAYVQTPSNVLQSSQATPSV